MPFKHKIHLLSIQYKISLVLFFQWWPSHSCDLSPLDHWLFSYLKQKVYSYPRPETVDQLWDKVVRCCQELDPEMVKRAQRDGMRKWCQSCVDKGGFYAK